MKKRIALLYMVAMVVVLSSVAGAADTSSVITPDAALDMMMKGNQSYVKGEFSHLESNSSQKARLAVAKGQHPYAVIVACSDSRVAPELLFDRGLGEVFVVRVAGNVVAPHELGSIEYAVEHLGAPLVMVLGHESCGAVTAAVNATGPVEGNIGSLVKSIKPAVDKARHDHPTMVGDQLVEAAVDENVKLVAEDIEAESPIVKELVEKGKLKIVGAKYNLNDGIVRVLPAK